MKKKLFFVLMICVLMAVVAVTLAGCGEAKLDAPRGLRVTDDGYLAWGAVEGADGYVVYFNEDESDRFYLTENYISVENPEILSSLKSGQKNSIYIRAVKMGKDNLPSVSSPRSRIRFNYSRKLATPNKIKMSKDRFSWRAVSGAEDYKAYVRRSDEETGTLYDMTWATGTASTSGTINDLPNGYLYYVSIVATANGYESSDPSDAVPYDRTAVNMGALTYTATAGDAVVNLSIDPAEEDVYVGTVTAKAGTTIAVADNNGKAYETTGAAVDKDGDYVVTLNVGTEKAKVEAIASYYIYVNGSDVATKFLFNAATDVYVVNVTLKDGDNYIIKDGAGNLVTTYTDGSVNQGSSVTAGEYAIRITEDKDKIAQVSVTSGTATDTGNSTPLSKDGMWAVIFDYNYDGAPASYVAYATDNRPVATPATPVRAGYDFEGWYEDAYCLIKAEFGKKQSNFVITAPTTFYAKWSADATVVEHTTHIDATGDGKCDVCGKTMTVVCTNHVDANGDEKCDVCGASVPKNPCSKHVDRNGDKKCDNCGADIEQVVVVDTTAKLYFDVSDFDWFSSDGASVNVHIWYTDGTNNGFPGPKMTAHATDADGTTTVYEADYYSSRTIKGIIFTRNNPKTNPDEGEATEWDRVTLEDVSFDPARPIYKLLSYYKNGETGYVSSSGAWIKEGEVLNTTGDGKIYLDFRKISWFMDSDPTNMVYVWYTDGSDNGAFPGKAVTYTGDATSLRYAYYVDYFTDKTVAGVIFTRNDPSKPLGQGIWNKIELTDFDPSKPAYRVTDLGSTFDGYWETEEEALSVPNVVTIEDTVKTKFFYLNTNAITWFADAGAIIKARITYADDSVNGKAGVEAIIEDGLYKWGYNGDKAISNIQILRIDPTTGDTWNSFVITLSATKDVVVVQSLEDGQAPSVTYSAKDGGDAVSNVTRTIYFTNNLSWSEVWGYAWKGDGDDAVSNANYPGVKLAEVDKNGDNQGIFAFTFSEDFEKVIFSGKAGTDSVKSVDIDLSALSGSDNAYYLNGWDQKIGDALMCTAWTYTAKTLDHITASYTGGDVTVGYEVSKSSVTVTAYYTDDSHASISDFTLSGYDVNTVGNQTVTVTAGGKTTTFEVTYVATATTRTIYFTDNWNWGQGNGHIYCYAFKAGTEVNNAAFPGELMTYVENNSDGQAVYRYNVSSVYDSVIFVKHDSSVQTVDIALADLGTNNAYYIAGWDGANNGKVTVGTWKK